ncbi:MAG: hypothetical protein OXB88_00825 [Bacteriovoracales bacterium]|nr:hypothetical protein [Bacteriovoracales bacterium]
MTLRFYLAKSKKDLDDIYGHNTSAFFDDAEFKWTKKWLETQRQSGYDIYQVRYGKEVVAALFVKEEEKGLLTKQTPLKFNVQGKGIGHKIKEYVEDLAKKSGKKNIFNYCAVDNFRMAALNESHGYEKTGKGDILQEWHKSLSSSLRRLK